MYYDISLMEIKQKIINVIGPSIEQLPSDMTTFQEMCEHLKRYNFCYLQGIEKAEYLLEQTRDNLRNMRRYPSTDVEMNLGIASDQLTHAELQIIAPIIDALIVDVEVKELSYLQLFTMYKDYQRIEIIMKELSVLKMYWATRTEVFLMIYKRLLSLGRALEKLSQKEYLIATTCP